LPRSVMKATARCEDPSSSSYSVCGVTGFARASCRIPANSARTRSRSGCPRRAGLSIGSTAHRPPPSWVTTTCCARSLGEVTAIAKPPAAIHFNPAWPVNEHALGELLQQTVRAGQEQTLFPGHPDQLFGRQLPRTGVFNLEALREALLQSRGPEAAHDSTSWA
jgi:hypothetical protein